MHSWQVVDPEQRSRQAAAELDPGLLMAIVAGAPDAILLTDASGLIRYANEHAGRLFGYAADALRGLSVDSLVPSDLVDRHREHRRTYSENPQLRPMGLGLELMARHHDGTSLPVEVSLSPLQVDGSTVFVAIVRDVSDRREADAALRRLQRLLDSSGEALFLCDHSFSRFLYVNEGAASLTGYPRGDLTKLAPADLAADPEERPWASLVSQDHEAPGAAAALGRLRRLDGTVVDVHILFEPFDWGAELAWAAFTHDLTDQLRAEHERQRAEQAIALAEEQERIARDLHDTVIQSLFGIGLSLQAVAGMTADGRVGERVERAIGGIDDAIRSMRATIFALHGSSPLSGGLREATYQLAREISSSLGFIPTVSVHGPVDFRIPDDVSEQLVPALREALTNVARHANATAVEVDLSVGDEVILTVADNGVGIADHPGWGNGLDNLRHRAEALGGSFKVQAVKPGGTVLEWRAPLG